MARNAQPLSDFSDGPPVLGHLPHRFHLELVRISFASHKDLPGCRKLWLQVVYESLGGPHALYPSSSNLLRRTFLDAVTRSVFFMLPDLPKIRGRPTP